MSLRRVLLQERLSFGVTIFNLEFLRFCKTILDNGVRRGRTLLLMHSMPVSRQITTWPSLRIGTIEAERVAIMSIDVDFTFAGSGSVVSTCVCIVVDEGTTIPAFLNWSSNVLHVGRIWNSVLTAPLYSFSG